MQPSKLNLRFYRWYAWKDLTEKGARRSTTAVVGTLATVQTLALLMLGLTWGYREAQEQQIEEDPIALCLFAGSRLRPDGITNDVLESLRHGAKRVAPAAKLFPLERTWLHFQTAPEVQRSSNERMSFKGRTILPDDPILRSYNVGNGVATSFGVVVTPSFLEDYGASSPPKHLVFHARGSDDLTEKVPVLGSTDKDLPDGYRFLIGESSLKQLEGMRHATTCLTGPVPEAVYEWRRWSDEQVKAMRDVLLNYEVRGAPELAGSLDPKNLLWELHVKEGHDGYGNTKWTELLKELRKVLAQKGIDLPAAFVENAKEQHAPLEPAPLIYDSIEILASDASELPKLGRLLDKLNLPYDRDTVDQLISLTRITNALSALLGFIAILVIAFSGFNIHTILAQRADQKMSEVGMLKAMGMKSSQLRNLYLVEGYYLWLGGALLAIAFSLLIGFSTQWIWNALAGKTTIVFQCPWWLLLVTLLLSGAVSMYCSMKASRIARDASPARSLSVTA